MIARLKTLIDQLATEASPEASVLSGTDLQLATAALLVEVATIDQHLDQTELEALKQLLSSRFELDSNEINTLVDDAKTASKESASLYQFTQLINKHCNDKEKYQLACELWTIAYADNDLDKYEEHIIRRIADLIHLRHSDFIRSKHQARDKANS